MRILYIEDDNLEIVKKQKDEIEYFIQKVILKHKLNINRKINVYKINFRSENFSDETIKMLFEKGNEKQRSEMFTKIY